MARHPQRVRLGLQLAGSMLWLVAACAGDPGAAPGRAGSRRIADAGLLDAGERDASESSTASRYALALRAELIVPGATALAIGDLSGEGRADLVVAGERTWLFAQRADGSLTNGGALLDRGVVALALVDVDADGSLDVVYASEDGVGSLRALGAGRFGPALSSAGPQPRGPLYPADVDGDGHVDLVALLDVVNDHSAVAYLGDGAGRFEPIPLLPGRDGCNYRALAVGDVIGDHADDLVVFCPDDGGAIEVYAHDGARGFAAAPVRHMIGNTAVTDASLTIADLNDDHRSDVLLAAGQGLPGVVVFEQTEAGTLERRAAVATGAPVDAVAVADADHDAHRDVFALLGASFRVVVYTAAPSGFRELTQVAPPATIGIRRQLALGDLDGDGCTDLALADIDGKVPLFYGSGCRAPR